MAEKQVVTGSTSHTVTLPNPHMVAPGTRFTIDAGEWECVHEGEHAFWETWKMPLTITVQVPNPDAEQ